MWQGCGFPSALRGGPALERHKAAMPERLAGARMGEVQRLIKVLKIVRHCRRPGTTTRRATLTGKQASISDRALARCCSGNRHARTEAAVT
eukprot:CAMPEP_0204216210 /NCGR_PEP_ID=MMETSP0361-20130328/77995_1 /ASSEMBLY_ACC=CAM_ASM_000343 /TAXON_ID=268821 /ORGANISM="Scrippsiella Hangoei, Strain SHTV-5" /LENGTH=90 /DNA_ID=CAMNT_0051181035 /DNA_START=86 /DNA_END=354 /DNA_ORIENTATION=+